jgi:hypothetical protein
MKHPLILATALTALAAAPALAGGMAEPAPTPVTVAPTPVASGADWTGPSVGIQLGYADVSTYGSAAVGGDGAIYGLRAYYDYDFGNIIVGGGLQYDGADIDLDGATTLESVTRVGARAGVDLTNSWVYGTAGWAHANTSDPTIGDSNGWFGGVGYEMLVSNGITIGAEVLYHEFSDFADPGLTAEATTAAVSVNFRF